MLADIKSRFAKCGRFQWQPNPTGTKFAVFGQTEVLSVPAVDELEAREKAAYHWRFWGVNDRPMCVATLPSEGA